MVGVESTEVGRTGWLGSTIFNKSGRLAGGDQTVVSEARSITTPRYHLSPLPTRCRRLLRVDRSEVAAFGRDLGERGTRVGGVRSGRGVLPASPDDVNDLDLVSLADAVDPADSLLQPVGLKGMS